MSESSNSYEQERRAKRDKLRELGVDPYGGRETGLRPLADIKQSYAPEMGHDGGPVVKAAGRVVLKRDMGKLSFLSLRDESGDLQVALDKKRLDELAWQVNDLIDLGDQIVVEGPLGVTKKGEVTIWATGLRMAAKALLTPPGKWDGLSDVELRYRQRYVDLWANPDVMKMMKLRMQIVDEIRRYLRDRGFLEVETPMMQTLAGGAAARPFETHHNALDIPLYMRIAPELYLKRLLVGGFTKVFELNRNFRNEGISPKHNPEFTMLEAYEAFGSWETMADLVEGMICHIAEKLFGGLRIEHKDQQGLSAIREYLQRRDASSLDHVCRARLDLLFSYQVTPAVVAASANELYARETGSEGYERNQDGFQKLVAEYEKELQGRSEAEQRTYLESRFVVKVINLARPWRRVKMIDLVREQLNTTWDGKQSLQSSDPGLFDVLVLGRTLQIRELLGQRALAVADRAPQGWVEAMVRKLDNFMSRISEQISVKLEAKSPPEQLQEVYEKLVEPTLIDPTFVTQVPSVIIPLAKKNREDSDFADVYELAINGQEISPGYSELNDPDVQAANFAHQVGDDAEKQKTDEDFLNALKFGMPPAGGMGMGIDRLVMMLTGAESIRDVILFPLMRPH